MAPKCRVEAAGTVPAAFAGVYAPRALLFCRFPATGTSSMDVQRRFLLPRPGGTHLRCAVSSSISDIRTSLQSKSSQKERQIKYENLRGNEDRTMVRW